MTTTFKQDQDFLQAMISPSLLEDALNWIRKNMTPDEVFSEDALVLWAREQDDILSWCDYAHLAQWALDNDFVEVEGE